MRPAPPLSTTLPPTAPSCRTTAPRLLLVNQTVGPLFMGVVAAATRRGPVTLMVGDSSLEPPARVRLWRSLGYRRRSGALRLLTWAGFSLQLAARLLLERCRQQRRHDHLLVVSNPPLAPLLAPLAGIPYSLLLYDLYPDVLEQLVPAGTTPGRRRLLGSVSALWRRANRAVYARAERVITLSNAMAEALQPYGLEPAEAPDRSSERGRSGQPRLAVVPPWADTSRIRPLPASANPFRREQGLDDQFLVLYSGNLGLTHPLEPLLEASAHVPASTTLLLIGDGPKRASLQRLALQKQLRRTRFLDPLPLEAVSQSYSAADLAVVCLDGPAARASLPSKTFTALATGTPILALAPIHSELAALVERHQCGLVVSPEAAPAAIAAAVNGLANDPPRLQRLAANALAASRQFGPANAVRLVDLWLGPPPQEPL